MLKLARQTQITDLVEQAGAVTVAELNTRLNVSEATIRRDLDELDRRGLLRRTHGGAMRAADGEHEPPIHQRKTEQKAEKERIGRRAASLVADGQTIFLGSGTTVEAMLPFLAEREGLTVITNSLPVVNNLAGRLDLIVIGGLFRNTEHSMVGHIAEAAIRELRADLVFMGMRGIDPTHGFTSDYLPEALTDRAILQIAPRRVILADHTKFGRVCAVYLAPVSAVEVVISDSHLAPAMAVAMREKGIEIIVA